MFASAHTFCATIAPVGVLDPRMEMEFEGCSADDTVRTGSYAVPTRGAFFRVKLYEGGLPTASKGKKTHVLDV